MSLSNPTENEASDAYDLILRGDSVFEGDLSCIQVEKLCELLQTSEGALLTLSGDPLCIRDINIPWQDISRWDDNSAWSDAPTPLVGEAEPVETELVANALTLNGIDQYISLASIFDTATDDYSITIRGELDELTRIYNLISKQSSSSSEVTCAIDLDGSIHTNVFNGAVTIGHMETVAGVLTAGLEFIVTLNKIGNTISLYVNDDLKSDVTWTGTPQTSPTIRIGAGYWNSPLDLFSGVYSQVVITRGSLTSLEITELHTELKSKQLLSQGLQSKIDTEGGMYLPLVNYEGFIGQELIDQSDNTYVVTSEGTPLTYTAQVPIVVLG